MQALAAPTITGVVLILNDSAAVLARVSTTAAFSSIIGALVRLRRVTVSAGPVLACVGFPLVVEFYLLVVGHLGWVSDVLDVAHAPNLSQQSPGGSGSTRRQTLVRTAHEDLVAYDCDVASDRRHGNDAFLLGNVA